jgi:hypothetical protein
LWVSWVSQLALIYHSRLTYYYCCLQLSSLYYVFYAFCSYYSFFNGFLSYFYLSRDLNYFLDFNVFNSIRLLYYFLVDNLSVLRLLYNFLYKLLNNNLFAEVPSIWLKQINLLFVQNIVDSIYSGIYIFILVNKIFYIVIFNSLSRLYSGNSNFLDYFICSVNWDINVCISILNSWNLYYLIDINPINHFTGLLDIYILMNYFRNNFLYEFVDID